MRAVAAQTRGVQSLNLSQQRFPAEAQDPESTRVC